MKTIKFVIFVLFFVSLSVGQIPTEQDYYPGSLFISVSSNIFNFPLESYAAYISFPTDTTFQFDKFIILRLRTETRIIEKRYTVLRAEFEVVNPELLNKISLKLPKESVTLFIKYGVYYIGRTSPTFSPADTLPHYVETPITRKLVTSYNYNKGLIIRFDSSVNVMEFADELKKLNFIEEVTPVARPHGDLDPNN